MDSDAEQRLDGNAAAGLLREVFAVELTAAIAVCGGCGRHSVVAELMLYGGALGAVLRCPRRLRGGRAPPSAPAATRPSESWRRQR